MKPPVWMVDGARVDYHSVIGERATKHGLTLRGEPFRQNGASGEWVAFVNGISGYVSCRALSKAKGDPVDAGTEVKA